MMAGEAEMGIPKLSGWSQPRLGTCSRAIESSESVVGIVEGAMCLSRELPGQWRWAKSTLGVHVSLVQLLCLVQDSE